MFLLNPTYIAGVPTPPPGPYDADVVILALDRPAETIAAIHSALGQSGITRHVFVIDQGSRAAHLTGLADVIAGRPDATLVALDRNRGVAGGRNAGTALGHGRIVAALDNDAEFATTDTLARAVAVLDDAPDLAAIACRIVTHATGADDLSSWGYPMSLLPHAGCSFDSTTFVGAGHAIRRAAWEQIGGYDESLFFCWEEFDFCLHAIQRGWRIRYCGDLVVRHKVSGEQRVAWSADRWFYFVRNRLYIGRKFGAGWPALVARFGGYLVKGLRHGMLRQTLRACAAAICLQPGCEPRALSPEARAYLWQNDGLHRGGWLTRLRSEVLARLPDGTL
ncbi:MAG TPA: glycosyltransferase [Acetobacteraceae bacterium]